VTPREWIGRLAAWRRRDRMAAELAGELEAHMALLARDYERAGMSPAEAARAARRQIGNVGRVREESRDAWGFPSVDALAQDLRYALRGIRRSPGFALTVIVTLALGIGANTAIFAVIDRLMFRPFPLMHDPASVHRVYLQTTYQGQDHANPTFPYLRYLDLRAATRTISSAAAESEWRFAVGTGAATTIRKVVGLTPSFFQFFDAPPALGRYFVASDDSATGAPVAVLSHTFWDTEFHGADVVGRHLEVGVVDYTIIGVAPAGFVGTTDGAPPEVFVPLSTIPANLGAWSVNSFRRDYSWDWVQLIVRSRPGAAARDMSAELTAAYVRSRAAQRALGQKVRADSLSHPRAIAAPVKLWAGPDAGPEPKVMVWVAGVAGIVLLIACVNVANMMIARVIRRRREIDVRLALGVRRGRLVRQFLTEAAVLALLGAAVGVAVAQWAGLAIRAMLLPQGTPFDLASDWRTLGVAAGCAVLATLITVVGPAMTAVRTDLASSLRGARAGGLDRRRLRAALLVGQGALSVVLLTGAGLFVRSFANARAVPLGYDARPVLEVDPDFRGYAMDSARSVMTRRALLAAAQNTPGVVAAARINSRLFATNTAQLQVAGIDSVDALGRFNFQITTPDYFRVMQTRIIRGRGFTGADGASAPPVTVVSEAMARALWPERDALGQCIHVGLGAAPSMSNAPCTTVIGIAQNTAQQNLADDPRFMYYLPVDQVDPAGISTMYLRVAKPDASGEVERIRRALSRAMPGSGFVVVRPLQEVVDDQERSWRLGATLFAAFGGLALVVAMVGLYGVVSYSVEQRRHELGVRVALGATRGRVVGLVVRNGLAVTGLAVIIGGAAAAIVAPHAQTLLFAESALDPMVYGSVAVAMLAAALAASLIPAARAAGTDPTVALRTD